MVARIFRPSKTAMQSGRGKTGRWVLMFDPEEPRSVEPLMGYTSAADMKQHAQQEKDRRVDKLEKDKSLDDRTGADEEPKPIWDEYLWSKGPIEMKNSSGGS